MMESTPVSLALSHVDPEMRNETRRHLISGDDSVLEALRLLNNLSGSNLTLFAVDNDGRLAGSLTDGDIRRALVTGVTLEARVKEICKTDCLKLDIADSKRFSMTEARRHDIILLPVVDDGFIVSLIDLRAMKGYVPVDGVLMAGGAGERLRPLTLTTPKPLLPVGGKPIIDHNIELMKSYGIGRIFITVNYLKEQLMTHVANASDRLMRGVNCIEEPEKLGTIGSLTLIDSLAADNIVVMNSDLLTDINFEEMYQRHIDTGAEMTVAVIPYTVSVPFAIIKHTGDRIDSIIEKPTYNYFANAGIYLLRKNVIKEIPRGKHMDAPDLVEKLIKAGRKVTQFPIRGRWIDIGSPDDYRHACDIMS